MGFLKTIVDQNDAVFNTDKINCVYFSISDDCYKVIINGSECVYLESVDAERLIKELCKVNKANDRL